MSAEGDFVEEEAEESGEEGSSDESEEEEGLITCYLSICYTLIIIGDDDSLIDDNDEADSDAAQFKPRKSRKRSMLY